MLIFFFTFSVLLPRLTAPGSSNRLIIKDLCDSAPSVGSVRPFRPTREGQHTRGNRKIISNAMVLSYFAKYYFCRCFRYLFPVLLVFKKFKVRMICKKLFEGPFVRHIYHLPRADSEAGYRREGWQLQFLIIFCFCFCYCFCYCYCFCLFSFSTLWKCFKINEEIVKLKNYSSYLIRTFKTE